MTKTILATTATFAFAMGATAMSAATDMDADGNGTYSYTELLAAYPALTEETFIAIDANGDGGVDDAELASAQETGLLPAAS